MDSEITVADPVTINNTSKLAEETQQQGSLESILEFFSLMYEPLSHIFPEVLLAAAPIIVLSVVIYLHKRQNEEGDP